MSSKVLLPFFITSFLLKLNVSGQESLPDTANTQELKFKYSALIIPTILIGYGAIGIESDGLKLWNTEINDELHENIDKKITIDDFSQYVPFLSVYGLNALGVKGKNNFRNRTIILASSYLIMGSTVTGLKHITKVERPDKSSKNSFPSGHTATAFMGAEFLWQEYKNVSIWYGIAGYVIATGTGFFRIYNERHWLTDVTAGAGIGMLSTKIAYWINPYVNRKMYKNNKNQSVAIVYPFCNKNQVGLGLSLTF